MPLGEVAGGASGESKRKVSLSAPGSVEGWLGTERPGPPGFPAVSGMGCSVSRMLCGSQHG